MNILLGTLFGVVVGVVMTFYLTGPWRKREEPSVAEILRDPGVRSCPYCPPVRAENGLYYGLPSAVIARNGKHAWCSRCGAFYSEGKWEQPNAEGWESHYRTAASKLSERV